MPRVFEPIKCGSAVEVVASGGLVEVLHKPYREAKERHLSLVPEIARRVATAMLKACDACDGLPSGFEGMPGSDCCRSRSRMMPSK